MNLEQYAIMQSLKGNGQLLEHITKGEPIPADILGESLKTLLEEINDDNVQSLQRDSVDYVQRHITISVSHAKDNVFNVSGEIDDNVLNTVHLLNNTSNEDIVKTAVSRMLGEIRGTTQVELGAIELRPSDKPFTKISTIEDHKEPVVEDHEDHEEPVIEDHKEPVVEDHEEPVIEDHEEPVIEDHEEPVVEDHEEPVIEDHEEPVVEGHEEPVVEGHEEPVVEGHDTYAGLDDDLDDDEYAYGYKHGHEYGHEDEDAEAYEHKGDDDEDFEHEDEPVEHEDEPVEHEDEPVEHEDEPVEHEDEHEDEPVEHEDEHEDEPVEDEQTVDPQALADIYNTFTDNLKNSSLSRSMSLNTGKTAYVDAATKEHPALTL